MQVRGVSVSPVTIKAVYKTSSGADDYSLIQGVPPSVS